MSALGTWHPCFAAHPVTNHLCHRRHGHDGPHRAMGPGFTETWGDGVLLTATERPRRRRVPMLAASERFPVRFAQPDATPEGVL